MSKTERKKIGVCGVDSGQLLLIDPCYIEGDWRGEDGSDEFGGGTYSECCHATLSEKRTGQLKYPLGHDGLGVVTSTGLGDGVYPVYAEFAEDGRVVSVEVVFIPHPVFGG